MSLSNILIKQLDYKKKTKNKAHIRKPYLPLAVTFCKHGIQALVDRDVVCTQCAPAKWNPKKKSATPLQTLMIIDGSVWKQDKKSSSHADNYNLTLLHHAKTQMRNSSWKQQGKEYLKWGFLGLGRQFPLLWTAHTEMAVRRLKKLHCYTEWQCLKRILYQKLHRQGFQERLRKWFSAVIIHMQGASHHYELCSRSERSLRGQQLLPLWAGRSIAPESWCRRAYYSIATATTVKSCHYHYWKGLVHDVVVGVIPESYSFSSESSAGGNQRSFMVIYKLCQLPWSEILASSGPLASLPCRGSLHTLYRLLIQRTPGGSITTLLWESSRRVSSRWPSATLPEDDAHVKLKSELRICCILGFFAVKKKKASSSFYVQRVQNPNVQLQMQEGLPGHSTMRCTRLLWRGTTVVGARGMRRTRLLLLLLLLLFLDDDESSRVKCCYTAAASRSVAIVSSSSLSFHMIRRNAACCYCCCYLPLCECIG